MEFSNYVLCDVIEDLFCFFLYLNESIWIDFGGNCNLYIVLKFVKCL